jgi:hypothetical protein
MLLTADVSALSNIVGSYFAVSQDFCYVAPSHGCYRSPRRSVGQNIAECMISTILVSINAPL